MVAQIWLGKQLLGQRDLPVEPVPVQEERNTWDALYRLPGGAELMAELSPLLGQAARMFQRAEAAESRPTAALPQEGEEPLTLPEPEPLERWRGENE